MEKILTILFLFKTLSVLGRDEETNVRILRSSVNHNPPFETVIVGPNGTRQYVGSGRNAVDWLALRLNLSIEIIFPSQELVKARSVEASIDLLVNGEADITSTGYVPTTERLEKAELTTFFAWEEGYRMIVPRTGEEHRLFAFVRPFQFSVWMLFGASIIAVTLGMGFFAWCYAKVIKNNFRRRRSISYFEHFGDYFMYNMNMLTNHGEHLSESRFTSFLILASFWLIGAGVLVYGYSGVVVSSLTLPQTKPVVDSLEDLLASKDVSLFLRTDYYPGMLIMNFSEAPLHKALREKVERDPQALINDFARLDKLLQTGKYASPFVDTFGRYYIGSDYMKTGKCKFKLSSRIPSLSHSYFFYFLRKGCSSLARLVSLRMMELSETGLGRFWVENSLFKADECFAPDINRPSAKQANIKLVDLTSAFFILGIGLSLSVLIFSCEFFYYYCVPK